MKLNSVASLILLCTVIVSCDRRDNSATSKGHALALPAIGYDDHIRAGGVPPPAGELRNPFKGDAANAKAGERLFASMNCDGCHGGGGSGWVGPSLADGRWRYGGDEDEIFNSIFYGRPKGMPAYGGAVGRDGVWMLVNYLKSLPKPDAVPTQSWIEPKVTVPRPDRNEETSGAAATTATAPTSASSPSPDFGTLLQKNGCTACHAVDKKVVGPAYRDVAAKYRGQKGAEQKLFASAKNGSVGVWGDIPMPPNAAARDADLHSIVKQILSLK
jgi:cytochrome c551/c552